MSSYSTNNFPRSERINFPSPSIPTVPSFSPGNLISFLPPPQQDSSWKNPFPTAPRSNFTWSGRTVEPYIPLSSPKGLSSPDFTEFSPRQEPKIGRLFQTPSLPDWSPKPIWPPLASAKYKEFHPEDLPRFNLGKNSLLGKLDFTREVWSIEDQMVATFMKAVKPGFNRPSSSIQIAPVVSNPEGATFSQPKMPGIVSIKTKDLGIIHISASPCAPNTKRTPISPSVDRVETSFGSFEATIPLASKVMAGVKTAFTIFGAGMMGLESGERADILHTYAKLQRENLAKRCDPAQGAPYRQLLEYRRIQMVSMPLFGVGLPSYSDKLITCMFGIANTFQEAEGNASHIIKIADRPNINIRHFYNPTHGVAVDLSECAANIFLRFTPNCAKDLGKCWKEFHLANLDNPKAKILHICHSQGAIHTLNELLVTPKEIRDRIEILPIAPAVPIPQELCSNVQQFASKNDLVPKVGPVARAIADSRTNPLSLLLNIIQSTSQIQKLEPHPDAQGMDHDFKSPTFLEIISNTLINFFNEEKRG
jgi:hypothetical protein